VTTTQTGKARSGTDASGEADDRRSGTASDRMTSPSRILRRLPVAAGLLAVPFVAIATALFLTPMQSVSVVGQTVKVGVAPPDLTLSGPGQLDLFGQSLPTRPEFTGPIRPRLVLTQITVTEQIAHVLTADGRDRAGDELGESLAAAWHRYFAWEIVVTGIVALILFAAAAGFIRPSRGRTVTLLLSGLLVTEALNVGGIVLTARDTPQVLAGVESLSGLVGRAERPLVEPAPGPARPEVQAIVLGDSTAAAIGNPLVADASDVDKACERSSESFAVALGRVNGWTVQNLACSGATISEGILGPQQAGNLTVPAQLAEAKRAVNVDTIVLSVGANDMNWSALVRLCAASPECDDKASTAYFQQRLQELADDYFELLRQLGTMPGTPRIVVNGYYMPFDPSLRCLDEHGLTAEKQEVLQQRLEDLNAVLEKGADAVGAQYVVPDFEGHELCTPQPYVQGATDPAPFHPTAAGELAIALAVQRTLAGTN
jgi:lysophospholipase L1-like esterase